MLRLRRLRFLPALLALVCMLCMQLALAAGACRPPAASHSCVCAEDDEGAARIAALCKARCNPDDSSFDSRQLPATVALAPPPVLLAVLTPTEGHSDLIAGPAARPDLLHAAGPPIAIAHCCLRN